MKTIVIIPAYNEQENIVNVVKDIKKFAPNVDHVVINDCSTDNTKNILINNVINYIELPVNLGIGGGVQTGYQYALERDYDIAIQFDGDGQHSAEYLNALIEPIKKNEADLVIGSRFLINEGFKSSWQRRFGITFLSKLIFLLSGTTIKDVTSGLRATNKKMIRVYANEYAQDYPEPEAVMLGSMVNARIVEIPVIMRERQAGKSSISNWKPIYYMIKVSLAVMLQKFNYGRRRVF